MFELCSFSSIIPGVAKIEFNRSLRHSKALKSYLGRTEVQEVFKATLGKCFAEMTSSQKSSECTNDSEIIFTQLTRSGFTFLNQVNPPRLIIRNFLYVLDRTIYLASKGLRNVTFCSECG